jgi:hypothetical protein
MAKRPEIDPQSLQVCLSGTVFIVSANAPFSGLLGSNLICRSNQHSRRQKNRTGGDRVIIDAGYHLLQGTPLRVSYSA